MMQSKTLLRIAIGAVTLVALAGALASAQDKYSLKVPGGLAFSEFRGYERWEVVAVHTTGDPSLLKLVVANPVAMAAYRSGVPGNGKPFPDGSRFAKTEWKTRQGNLVPYEIKVPDSVYDIDFMVKDSKRFAGSGGWGYAVFKHDDASDSFVPATLSHSPPQGNDAKCGAACHTIAKGRDFVFTELAKR